MEEMMVEDGDFSKDAERALGLMETPKAWPPLAHREKGGYIIDLIGAPYDRLPAHRRILLLLLQLAVKDRASELRFEPWRFPNDENGAGGDEVGFRLSYQVEGDLHELVPPPSHLTSPVSREIETLAGLDSLHLRTAHVLRRIAGKIDRQETGPRRGRFAVRVGDVTTDVEVFAYADELGERYFLNLAPIPAAVSQEVWTEMRRIFERRHA